MSTVLCDVFDINHCAYNIGSFHKVAFQRSTDHPRTDTFCSCDLGLDLITLTYKSDLDILKTYLYTLILLRSIQGEGEEWSFYGDRTCVEQCCARCHRHSEDRGLSQILHDELHWLDVPDRVFFKLAVLVHRCLNGRTQPYLSDYCVPVASAVTRRHLRSATVSYLQYLATVSTLTAAVPSQSPAHSLELSRISFGTRPSEQSISDVCLKRICSFDTSAFSALEVLDDYCAT